MKKELMSTANFRATLTIVALSIAITVMIKKYTR